MKENIAGYLFILPNLLGVFFFIVLPLLFSLYLVFMDWDYLKGFSGLTFAGLDNVVRMTKDEYLGRALVNNAVFTAVTVPLAMVTGLMLAVIINRFVYLKNMLRTIFFLPYVSSLVAVSIVWSVLYNARSGPINSFLRDIGISNPPGWLASPQWALIAIIILVAWTYIGYTLVLYMAGLQGIPKDLYEAASIDGANRATQFFKITVPMLKPTSFLIAITLIISTFQVFAVINIMTQGGPLNSTMVMAYHIYLQAFQYYKMGYAATLSWLLFCMIFIVTLVQWRSQKKWQQHF
ncbi:carbohydrate ABC transporter permease [Paenibacillus sp. GCM10012307]|uniref:Sugar ABC transporter permease n=1 Tax=Paenibacillus roseus TaxID=2798579 RepID=A0A934J5N5_9BACL|nr:sugar ABC transporter permease [Paenibacillus roseus]MBJ6362028.1 sugar ABC transporter permease [Paenibacillus roseus]